MIELNYEGFRHEAKLKDTTEQDILKCFGAKQQDKGVPHAPKLTVWKQYIESYPMKDGFNLITYQNINYIRSWHGAQLWNGKGCADSGVTVGGGEEFGGVEDDDGKHSWVSKPAYKRHHQDQQLIFCWKKLKIFWIPISLV